MSLLLYLTMLVITRSALAQWDVVSAGWHDRYDSVSNSGEALHWSGRTSIESSTVYALNRTELSSAELYSLPQPRLPTSLLIPYGERTSVAFNNTAIALISCDLADYQDPGRSSPKRQLDIALGNGAAGVIFYTRTNRTCALRPWNASIEVPILDRVWTIDSQTLSIDITTQFDTTPLLANIGGDMIRDYNAWTNLTGVTLPRPTETGITTTTISRPTQGMNTQVAMYILYTVTGIVTALFLFVITTGAIRAHRHPERYGPLNIMGRPRQTRARGLARAMLDGLPIVKFSNPSPQKTDAPAPDAEMGTARTGSVDAGMGNTTSPTSTRVNASSEAGRDMPAAAAAANGAHDSAIGPAIDEPDRDGGPSTARGPGLGLGADNHPGCSICTEDFEEGQDLRVLPCDHRFHPACVDPWLLNVSGTCPLCRIDLRAEEQARAGGQRDAGVARDGDLPPPLEMDGAVEHGRRASLRRSLFGPPRAGASREEAVEEALRWLRNGRGGVSGAGPVLTDPVQERDRRRRFGRVFGIRTRREGGGPARPVSGVGSPPPRATMG